MRLLAKKLKIFQNFLGWPKTIFFCFLVFSFPFYVFIFSFPSLLFLQFFFSHVLFSHRFPFVFCRQVKELEFFFFLGVQESGHTKSSTTSATALTREIELSDHYGFFKVKAKCDLQFFSFFFFLSVLDEVLLV
jgi:hypothetical protein